MEHLLDLVSDNPGPPGKWPLKRRERITVSLAYMGMLAVVV